MLEETWSAQIMQILKIFVEILLLGQILSFFLFENVSNGTLNLTQPLLCHVLKTYVIFVNLNIHM